MLHLFFKVIHTHAAKAAVPFLFLSMMAAAVSCGTDAVGEPEPGWAAAGFEDVLVTVVEPDGEGLLVGTEQGLYRRTGSQTINLGLNDHEIMGVVRLNDNSLLAGVRASAFSSGDVTLFRLRLDGAPPEPYLNNFGGDDGRYTWIDRGPISSHVPSDTLFVRGNGFVAYSTDGGQYWELVFGRWEGYGGFAALLSIDPYHLGRLWAGGVNALSQAYLWKANNFKENNWINRTPGLSENIEAVAYDVITHPEDPDLVLVGLGGAIAPSNRVKKSADGGESWQTVLEETGIHTFARSRQAPSLIYASGRDPSTKPFFASTSDFGETWDKEIFDEGPSVVTTNDLAVLTIAGHEVLFMATSHGLFSYRVD